MAVRKQLLILLNFLILQIVLAQYDWMNPTPTMIPPVRKPMLSLITGKCEDMKHNVSLRFSDVGLTRIPDNFIDSPHVSCLSVSDNNISAISRTAFRNVPNLRFLDLSRNNIPVDSLFFFTDLPNLKTLVADRVNPLFSVSFLSDSIFSNFPSLKHLYLRDNNIHRWSNLPLSNITPNLTHLYLSGNDMQISEDFLTFLPNTLTDLHLEQNSLGEFSCRKLNNIQHLYLDQNRIQSICGGVYCSSGALYLNGGIKLKTLSLRNNQIYTVHIDSFDNLRDLTSLDLSGNKIANFRTGTFDSLIKLQNFSVADNQLTHLPDLSSMPFLRNLKLSRNAIQGLPRKFGFSSLKVLELDGNNITNIDDATFRNLTSLEVLDLSANQLHRMNDGWDLPLKNLGTLLMKRNLFTNFQDLRLKNVKLLRELHLQGNPISQFNTRFFFDLPQNLTVYLAYERREENTPSDFVENKPVENDSETYDY